MLSLSALLCAAGLLAPATRADEPATTPADTTGAPSGSASYRAGRGLGKVGAVLGYAGPPVAAFGALIALEDMSFFGGDTSHQKPATIAGLVLFAGGWGSAILGPVVLASGSVIGAKGIAGSGGPGDAKLGWIAAGASATQIASLSFRLGGSDSLAWWGLGATAWGMAMVCGTGQHLRNEARQQASASLKLAPDRPRVRLNLVSTGRGAALFGTF